MQGAIKWNIFYFFSSTRSTNSYIIYQYSEKCAKIVLYGQVLLPPDAECFTELSRYKQHTRSLAALGSSRPSKRFQGGCPCRSTAVSACSSAPPIKTRAWNQGSTRPRRVSPSQPRKGDFGVGHQDTSTQRSFSHLHAARGGVKRLPL